MGSHRARQSKTYRIVIRGELSDRFQDLFENMQLSREAGNTVLVGEVVDQAQLYGLIEQTQSLGFELLSVNPAVDAAGHS